MTGGFRYQPAGIRSTAPQFGRSADGVEESWNRLEHGNSQGSCWGSDEGGREFESGYRSKVGAVDQQVRTLVNLLEDIQTKLIDSADSMESTDQRGASVFDGGMR